MENQYLQGIDTIIVRVSDIEKSKVWYVEKLGLKVLYEDSSQKLVVLESFGPTSLTLWQTSTQISPIPETASYPIFKTSDASKAHQYFQSKGIKTGELKIEDPVTYFQFFDLDGNILEVCQVHE